MKIYEELASWYAMLDPVEDHADEAELFRRLFTESIQGPGRSLLELGAGSGHNAHFLKDHFRCTLTDRSKAMLERSRALNPECTHELGDMRTLRLERTFDAVLVHDSICYLTTEADLRAAFETAFLHLRPGGAGLFVPDCILDTFHESHDDHEGTEGDRQMRCLAWMWDPDPRDSIYTVDYAFLLREGNEVRAVHDRHIEGLFDRATWLRLLREVGFAAEIVRRPLDEHERAGGYTEEIFLGRKTLDDS